MTVNRGTRIVMAGGLSALAVFVLSGPISAQGQGRGRSQGQLGPQDQQERVRQQEQRSARYRDHVDQQDRVAQKQSALMQQQKRNAQYRSQQQYVLRVRQQQSRIRDQGRYYYMSDSYFYTAPGFRYSRAGRYYETNQYGVDLLRQAVNYGYDEGTRAGLADKQDRWASNYRDSYAYQDANYGYSGFYVDQDEYNFYFREGFRRGYEDSYDGRYRYGRYADGRGTMSSSSLALVLSFESIR